MKLKDSEKGILLILLGIAVLVLCGFYVVKPNIEKTTEIANECVQLQQRLDYLRAEQAKRDDYLAWTEEFNAKFDEILAKFPADLNQEVTIMFLEGIKNDNIFDISSLGLGAPEQFYVLGSNATGDVDLTATAPAPETPTTETPATGDVALTEDVAPSEDAYTCYRAAFPITYEGSYEALKNVISYIDNFSSRMVVDSVDIAYNPDEDVYMGSMNLMCYAVQSPERPESNLELEDVKTGVDNIFLGEGSISNSVAAKMTKYDEDNGASIESAYDFYVMLNAASSDVSAKVVGQNGSGKEASVISNSDNTVSVLSYDFYEVDGKNYCKYTLDNSTSYEAEITSAEDIKLLIQSSARKDTDDKAGVRVTIRNTTSLPVYVKVTGDDTVNPRVQIVNKTGAVKVY